MRVRVLVNLFGGWGIGIGGLVVSLLFPNLLRPAGLSPADGALMSAAWVFAFSLVFIVLELLLPHERECRSGLRMAPPRSTADRRSGYVDPAVASRPGTSFGRRLQALRDPQAAKSNREAS